MITLHDEQIEHYFVCDRGRISEIRQRGNLNGKWYKISAVFIIVLCTINLSICFSLVNIQAQNSLLIAEHSMGWIVPMNWNLIFYPKNSVYNPTPNQFSTSIPKFNSKYAIIVIVSGLAQNALLEGQNSQGLGLSPNFLPGFGQCQTVTKDDKLYISVLKFGQRNKRIYLCPPKLHFLITAQMDEVIIIEFTNGQMKIFNKNNEFLTTKLLIPISTCH